MQCPKPGFKRQKLFIQKFWQKSQAKIPVTPLSPLTSHFSPVRPPAFALAKPIAPAVIPQNVRRAGVLPVGTPENPRRVPITLADGVTHRDPAFRLSFEKMGGTFGNRPQVAFTLAEVLITLGIIGIVAAMTLPAVINKAEKFILANRFKKSYATLSNAINLAQGERGMPFRCYVMASGNYPQDECREFWSEVIPKLNAIRVCDYADADCRPNYKTVDEVRQAGGSVDNRSCSLTNSLGYHKVYTLSDGSYVIINSGENGALHYSQWVVMDVNGEKGPNKWGYDVFFTSVYSPDIKKNVILADYICKMKEKGGEYFKDMILK